MLPVKGGLLVDFSRYAQYAFGACLQSAAINGVEEEAILYTTGERGMQFSSIYSGKSLFLSLLLLGILSLKIEIIYHKVFPSLTQRISHKTCFAFVAFIVITSES